MGLPRTLLGEEGAPPPPEGAGGGSQDGREGIGRLSRARWGQEEVRPAWGCPGKMRADPEVAAW